MARIRTFKPEFWSDSKTGMLSGDATKLFFGILSFCDDYGVIRFDVAEFAAKIFPFENFLDSSRLIDNIISLEIIEKRLAITFSLGFLDDSGEEVTERFLWVKNFEKHQKVDKPGKPILPGWESGINPRGYAAKMGYKFEVLGGGGAGGIREISRTVGSIRPGRERIGKERKGSSNAFSGGEKCPSPAIEKPAGDQRGDGGDIPAVVKGEEGEKKTCPHQQILKLYHERLPMLAKVREWKGEGKRNLQARWNEDKGRQSLEFWECFFSEVAASDFLTGRKTDFRASLGWLVRPQNFEKVINGQYQNNGNGSSERKTCSLREIELAATVFDFDGEETFQRYCVEQGINPVEVMKWKSRNLQRQ